MRDASAEQGINAIIFYAPVLFEQLGGNGLGGLLNTVIIDVGEPLPFAALPHAHAMRRSISGILNALNLALSGGIECHALMRVSELGYVKPEVTSCNRRMSPRCHIPQLKHPSKQVCLRNEAGISR